MIEVATPSTEKGLFPFMSWSMAADLPLSLSIPWVLPTMTEPASWELLRATCEAPLEISSLDLVSRKASSLDARNDDTQTPEDTLDAFCRSGLPRRILVPVASKRANTSLEVQTTVFCSAI